MARTTFTATRRKTGKSIKSKSKDRPAPKPPRRAAPASRAGRSNGRVLPPRAKVRVEDQWDLSHLFKTDADWEAALAKVEGMIPQFEQYKGRLGESAGTLAACLALDADLDRLAEGVGVYAYLKAAEDQADSAAQRMRGRYQHVATRASEASSFIRPELMDVPPDRMDALLADPQLAGWRVMLERILRYRPHTLGKREEQLLAMQGQMADAANQVFRQLTDADLKWPMVRDERGRKVELGHSSYSMFLHSPDRRVRKEAFHTYYTQFDAHKNALAAAYNGSVQRDAYYAKARGYPSALESALFGDRVPVSVYDNLVASVHRALPTVYKYLEVRRKALRIKDVHQYDTYVPILSDVKKHHTWDQAVRVVVDALRPLGDEYCRELHRGMTAARWCDRYPNKGKQSGAFSYGTYDGQPYILMNFQPTVLDHVFTLAHEAGHSMHSFYSARTQPFQYWHYTIFVAEVASTFNEQLLLRHMIDRATTRKERAYLVNHAIDEIRGTIVRQTMFAEFERVTHALVERGEPLTVETLRREYRKLLDLYFGPAFVVDPELELECLRIPHFYRAFYVYKYATGLSAAIALSERVMSGGQRELDDYLRFLKGGCSRYPLDLLRAAGVDMEQPAAVDAAMGRFAQLVDELESLV